jgi:hypothetical protein
MIFQSNLLNPVKNLDWSLQKDVVFRSLTIQFQQITILDVRSFDRRNSSPSVTTFTSANASSGSEELGSWSLRIRLSDLLGSGLITNAAFTSIVRQRCYSPCNTIAT